jgi:acyl phosphate:glycerol-3-phosphate acyltransferase
MELNPTMAGLLSFSYLLGSIPFGLLIAKIFYGVDIRQRGSGNPGATNVWRNLGRNPGIATLTLDIVKGVIPVVVAKQLFPYDDALHVLCGLAAIIGHNWSVFLKMKGGKGVATSAGVFLGLIPKHAAIAILVFLIVFFISKHVSVGSMAGAVALLVSSFIFQTPVGLRVVIVIAATLVLIKHVPNMKRLAAGTEPKVNFR